MTPKEKAQELTNKFKEHTEDDYAEHWWAAKQCALIAVDEILNLPYHHWMSEKQANEFCNYWQQVKTEIENL